MWIIKFYSFDLDLDLMTLLLKLDLDVVKMYVCSKNKVPNFNRQPEQVYRQTDSIEIITYTIRAY